MKPWEILPLDSVCLQLDLRVYVQRPWPLRKKRTNPRIRSIGTNGSCWEARYGRWRKGSLKQSLGVLRKHGAGGSLGRRILSLDFDVSSSMCHWYPKRKMAHRNSGAKSRPWKWVGESRVFWRWDQKGKGCSARREEEEGQRLRECLLVQFMIHVTFRD